MRGGTALSAVLCAVLWGCSAYGGRVAIGRAVEKDAYARQRATQGVVLLSVNWGRQWGCAGFENAQLLSLSFDRLSEASRPDGQSPDLSFEAGNRLLQNPVFTNYAVLVEPGTYALSGFGIKRARSVTDVESGAMPRSRLIEDGRAKGGTFSAAAGETVYIGNFFLDCAVEPILWRYYTEERNLGIHLDEFRRELPFLDLRDVRYRLFATEHFGVNPDPSAPAR